MLFLAILATLGAVFWMLFVGYANGMRSSSGPFEGGGTIVAAFAGALALWVAWLIG